MWAASRFTVLMSHLTHTWRTLELHGVECKYSNGKNYHESKEIYTEV